MKTNTANTTQIQKQIDAINSEPRALIGSDEGTHGKPTTFRIYEEISGERYAVWSHGNSNGTRCTVAEASEETDGRIRMFRTEIARIGSLRKELRSLEKELRN